jgi:hypothetical protein
MGSATVHVLPLSVEMLLNTQPASLRSNIIICSIHDTRVRFRATAMKQLRIGLSRFGWEMAHEAVSRRPPILFSRTLARTEGYTHAA